MTLSPIFAIKYQRCAVCNNSFSDGEETYLELSPPLTNYMRSISFRNVVTGLMYAIIKLKKIYLHFCYMSLLAVQANKAKSFEQKQAAVESNSDKG